MSTARITSNHEDRQAAMKFASRNAGVDYATAAFKSTLEMDEALQNLNQALT